MSSRLLPWAAITALAATSATLHAQAQPASTARTPLPLPSGWYSGDTHVHAQLCGIPQPPSLTPAAIYGQQQVRGLNVASVLLWASPGGGCYGSYLHNYAPLVRGSQHAVTRSDPLHWLQYDVEVSSDPCFPAAQFGHVVGLGLHNGYFPVLEVYPSPILDTFRAQGAITGYAHNLWPVDNTFPIYVPRAGVPYMAPLDVAMGKVDYLESTYVPGAFLQQSVGAFDWTGLYYKLLRAGFRVGLAAGSDNSCLRTSIGDARTYAYTGSTTLDYRQWIKAIANGVTSIADGDSEMLDLRVEGQLTQREVRMAQPGPVHASATLHVQAGVSFDDSVYLLQGGVPVASQRVTLPVGGSAKVDFTVPVVRSDWLAARTLRTHTAAFYVVVDDEPIASAADADYLAHYCDDLISNIGFAMLPPADEKRVTDYVRSVQPIFSAYAALDRPPPQGLERYGRSTPACRGPIAVCATAPRSGAAFDVTCLNAPPHAIGMLLVSAQPLREGVNLAGTGVFVDVQRAVATPLIANGGGYAHVSMALPAGSGGSRVFLQCVWANPTGCGTTAASASDALAVTVQ